MTAGNSSDDRMVVVATVTSTILTSLAGGALALVRWAPTDGADGGTRHQGDKARDFGAGSVKSRNAMMIAVYAMAFIMTLSASFYITATRSAMLLEEGLQEARKRRSWRTIVPCRSVRC